MRIANFSVKNSKFVNLMSLVVILAGIFCYTGMYKEAFPPVDRNRVFITTYYPNASPEKVAQLVTIPIEKELKEVDDVDEITSKSVEGSSSIAVTISEKASDKDKVINDIQKAVDRVSNLPEGVTDRPLVIEHKMTNIPVIRASLTLKGNNVDIFHLRDLIDRLKEDLEDIKGVASVNKAGWDDEQYWVCPDIKKMKEYNISFSEIIDSLKKQNVTIPGGKQEYDGIEREVKVNAEFHSLKDIKNTIVRANDMGTLLRISDIALVKQALKDSTTINKTRGKKSIELIINKQEKSDIINIVKAVKQKVESFKDKYKEINIELFDDLSFFVRRRLKVLKSNGLVAFILVTFTLFVFLPPVSALMTSLGIPIAFFTTFCIMQLFGLTINLLTMFGLIMVLGIIVDDGIIISENVFRYIEKGLSVKKSAVIGTDEVAGPVLSTILTTIVAFSPLMFMTGTIGKFIKYIPFVVIIALVSSLIEAYFILPSHLADFAGKYDSKYNERPKWFYLLRDKYLKFLNICLNKRYLVCFLVLLLFFGCIIGAKHFIPFKLFGGKGVEKFGVLFEADTNINIHKMNELIKPFEKYINDLPEKYINTYTTTIGKTITLKGSDKTRNKSGSNYAMIAFYLTPPQKRDKDIVQIVDMIRPAIAVMAKKACLKIEFSVPKGGPPVGSAIDVGIRADDYDAILKTEKKVRNIVKTIDGAIDINSSYKPGAKQINIIIDEEKAQKAFISNSDIASAIRAAFSGMVATTIKPQKAEKEIEVLVRLSEEQREDRDILDKIFIKNKYEKLILLKNIVKLVEKRSLRSIQHYNGKKIVSVTANVDEVVTTSLVANKELLEKLEGIKNKHSNVQFILRGERKETVQSLYSLLKAFLIALFLIFVILATQFNSLSQPLIVMIAIPLSLIGVIFAFFIHNDPLSFMALLGCIGLMGVVVNDSIILVEFINRNKEADADSDSMKNAVMKAGKLRFRPVLITTITTVLGLFTVAYGIGGFDPFLRPMALAMSWGLLFATVLTLIIVPCIYMIMEDIINRERKK